MQREEFIEGLVSSSDSIYKPYILSVLNRSIDSFKEDNVRGHSNLIIVMEELAELTKEVSKELRGSGDCYNILQELADVQIGIYYIQEICGISNADLNKGINVKIKNLIDKLNKDGQYK